MLNRCFCVSNPPIAGIRLQTLLSGCFLTHSSTLTHTHTSCSRRCCRSILVACSAIMASENFNPIMKGRSNVGFPVSCVVTIALQPCKTFAPEGFPSQRPSAAEPKPRNNMPARVFLVCDAQGLNSPCAHYLIPKAEWDILRSRLHLSMCWQR